MTQLQETVEFYKDKLKSKEQELQDLHELFTSYKSESEELEDTLEKQSLLFEKDLKNSILKQQKIEKLFQKQLEEQQKKFDLEISEKNELIFNQEKDLLYKQKLLDAYSFMEQGLKTDGANNNIEQLNLLLTSRNKVIEELVNEIQVNKDSLRSQSKNFQDFKSQMQQFQTDYEQRLKDIVYTKDYELSVLNQQIIQKEEQILQLKETNQAIITDEEIETLRKMIRVQSEQLKSIQLNFTEYRINAEFLLDKKITQNQDQD